MRTYFLRRLFVLLGSLFVIVTVNFVLFRLMPGSPVDTVISPDFTPEMKALLMERYGLNEPYYIQYGLYLKNLISLNFGRSFQTRLPVWDELLSRLPNTLLLLGSSFLIMVVTGVALGIFVASRRGSRWDTVLTGSAVFFGAMPGFFIALLLLLVFGYYIDVFPVHGTMSAPPPTGFWPRVYDRLLHLVLPVASIVVSGVGSWMMYTRNHLVTTLAADFIRTAQAKGLSKRRVLYGHALRSSLPPLVTLFFLSLPNIITGAVVIESIFSIQGIGRYLLQATLRQDYPAIEGAFFFIAVAVLLCNLLADFVYRLVDPRIEVR